VLAVPRARARERRNGIVLRPATIFPLDEPTPRTRRPGASSAHDAGARAPTGSVRVRAGIAVVPVRTRAVTAAAAVRITERRAAKRRR